MTSTKWKAPQNFVSMADNLRCVNGDTECADTASELWLVQVPQGFDVSTLNKLDTSVVGLSGGTQTLKVKTEQEKKMCYSVAAFRESADCKTMSTMVTDASGQTVLGRDVSSMLVVTETAAHCAWHAHSALLAPKKPVPMPSGLRPRFTPFGAGTPCPSISGKFKKIKRASKGEESMEEVCQDVKKTSKKRKRGAQVEESVEEEVRQDSKKRKREASPDSCEEPPLKKKKKKSKHRHSESMDVHNGDAGNTLSLTESPAGKKKKRRKSEGSIQDSSAGGDLFVLDTPGDRGLVNDEQLVSDDHNNSKHKKSKKKKKQRTPV